MDLQEKRNQEFWAKEVVQANLIWPDEFVIRFVKKNFRNIADTVVLDYGCGAGRNAIALAKEGYKVIAMDYSQEAISLVEQKKEDLEITTVCNDGVEVPLAEQSVDAIIADGSLFYSTLENTTKILKELGKCMKPNAKFWANWRSKEDSLYGKGMHLDDGLYCLDATTKREGCTYLFVDEAMVRQMFEEAGLVLESLEQYYYTENNGQNRCAYYHTVAVKK